MGSRGICRVVAALFVGVACPHPGARADDDVPRVVGEALAQIASPDAGVRRRAADRLRALGADAIPHVVATLGGGAAAFEAGVAALVAIGADASLAEIEACRSRWNSLGLVRRIDERKPRSFGDEAVDRLIDARTPTWSAPVTLAPATLDDPFRVPPRIAEPIGDALPSHLAWADVPVRREAGRLAIDTARDGSFATRVADNPGAAVVTIGAGPAARRVLVFRRSSRWYAASAALLRGNAAPGLPVELLDVEGDGDFTGRDDLVRFGTGAFRRVGDSTLTWCAAGPVKRGLVRFRLRRDGASGASVSVVPEPVPAWLTGGARAVADELNAWRDAAGIAPQRIDRDRWTACRDHHGYWDLNGFSGHDQDAGRAGASPAGAEAGRRSSCWQGDDGAGFVRTIGATVLHRQSLCGRADEGAGAFAGRAGSLLWGGSVDRLALDDAILVPGPGQTGTPLACEAEQPRPASDPIFYSRSRGFPVSVTWSGNARATTTSRKVEVVPEGAATPLRGTTFSAETPYDPDHRSGWADASVVFVPDSQLTPGLLYTARFTCTTDDGPVEIVWQFRAGPR